MILPANDYGVLSCRFVTEQSMLIIPFALSLSCPVTWGDQ